MIKGYKFLINEEEKERIISLHKTRTSQQYLNEDALNPTKAEIYSMIKELGFKTANEFMDAYLKKFPVSGGAQQIKVDTPTSSGSTTPISSGSTTPISSGSTTSLDSTKIISNPSGDNQNKIPVGDQKNNITGETPV